MSPASFGSAITRHPQYQMMRESVLFAGEEGCNATPIPAAKRKSREGGWKCTVREQPLQSAVIAVLIYPIYRQIEGDAYPRHCMDKITSKQQSEPG